jgi:hypothetical protein
MGRTRTLTYALVVVMAAPAAIGCGPGTLWHLFGGGKDKIEPDQPLPAKDGKKDVTVAILSSASPGLGIDFAGVDRELALMVGRKLVEESKEEKVKFVVIDQPKVDKYLSTHPNWKVASPGRIAKDLGADYLIDMSVQSLSMFQPDYGREAYSGRSTVQVAVYDADAPDSPLREYVQVSSAPAKDTASGPPAQYRQWFLNRVATEIAWRHIPHGPQRELGPLK